MKSEESSGSSRGADPAIVEELTEQAFHILGDLEDHRREIALLAAQRRAVVEQLVMLIGPVATSRRLQISRQTVREILKPEVAKERKAKLRGGTPEKTPDPIGAVYEAARETAERIAEGRAPDEPRRSAGRRSGEATRNAKPGPPPDCGGRPDNP